MSNYLEEHGYYVYLDAAVKTLKECPLCKGKAKYIAGSHFGFDEEWGSIRCDDCGLELRVKLYSYGNYDPLHAFDAWNTRYERTCEKVPGKMHYGERRPKCSECGYGLGDPRWTYCPSCGAKVSE